MAQGYKGAFTFFAVGNSHFNKDTPDGKHTFHATATALYQRQESFTVRDTRKLRLHGQKPRDHTLTSRTAPAFVPCCAPKKQSFNGVTTVVSLKPKTTFDVMQPYSA